MNLFGEEQLEEGTASQSNQGEDDEVMEVGEREYEVEMNWNICRYLPEAGSCQEIFKVIIAGHIQALYEHLVEIQKVHEPGSTPIQRRTGSTQTQQVEQCYIQITQLSCI